MAGGRIGVRHYYQGKNPNFEDSASRQFTIPAIFKTGAIVALLLAGNGSLLRGEVWLKVVGPQFTLYTPAKSTDALRTATEFQQFIGALGEIVQVDTRTLPPLTIVMFSREKDFRPFRPQKPNGKPWDVAGFFSRQDGWSVFGLAGAEMDEEVRRTVFHEGVHWFFSGTEFSNPPWLEEGLAEVFSTFSVEKNIRKWGQPIAPHLEVLHAMQLMTLERLLSVSHSDPLFNEARRTGLFYAESWAFVHFLLFGEYNQGRTLFNDYLRAYRSGIHPDDAFKVAFKMNYSAMDRALSNYLSNGQYFVGGRPLSPAGLELKAEPASDLEREVALTRLALGANHRELAQSHLALARKAGPDAMITHEVAGYAAGMGGDEATMLEEFDAAARLGSRDYRVYFDPAQRRHQAGKALGETVELSATEARRIANGYEKTINVRPWFLSAYQGLGGVIGLLGRENQEDRLFLQQGATLFPDDGMIQLGLATSAREAGDKDEARNELAKLLANPQKFPPNVTSYAQNLGASWAFEENSERIRVLAETEHYEEALAALDELLAKGGVPQPSRASMAVNRANILAAVEMSQMQVAWSEQRWSDARKLLETILSSPVQTGAKHEARRRLAELDRRELGRN